MSCLKVLPGLARLCRVRPRGKQPDSTTEAASLEKKVGTKTVKQRLGHLLLDLSILLIPKPKFLRRRGDKVRPFYCRREETLVAFEENLTEVAELDEDVEWPDLSFEDEELKAIQDESLARKEWLRQKREDNEENVFLDLIMSMVGHEQVKAHFLDVKSRMEAARRRDEDVKRLNFNLVLHGNDGTGKRRIAQLYAEFLYSIGAVPRRRFKCSTGGDIPYADDGSTVIFFQDADLIIDQDEDVCGRPINQRVGNNDRMKDLLKLVHQKQDGAVMILSYRRLSETSKSALQGTFESRERFQRLIRLQDYNEDEMVQLLKRLIKNQSLEVEDDTNNTVIRALARKALRDQSIEGHPFNNVHALKAALDQVCKRRTRRIAKDWSKLYSPSRDGELDIRLPIQGSLTRQDIYGPEPSDLRSESKAWKEIQNMIGLKEVKKEVDGLFNLARENYQREIRGEIPLAFNLNRVFVGDPGVGKTTVAMLYGQIVAQLGLVSNGQVITKTPEELISGYIAQTETITKKILEEAKGNVLIIDNAHGLYPRDEHDARHEVIDTLVANISGLPGEDRCIILSGYADRIENTFLKINPGLQSRFPRENFMLLPSYNDAQLYEILRWKMTINNILISDHGSKIARELLSQMRTRPRFGNGFDVESFLARARRRQTERLNDANVDCVNIHHIPLEAEDFDPNFNRLLHAGMDRDKLFEEFVGFENINSQFKGYQKMTDGMRRTGRDPRPYIPWAFVFKGPPGTGKTSTATKVGKLFYDMGFTSSDEVITCSATDLIGEYLGHTGPKVINQFEKGLGKVLFIDEAYRLNPSAGNGSDFHREAVGEIVNIMTDPRFSGNMVVILAGYDKEMEDLMRLNPGLRSRFPTNIMFPPMAPEICLHYLTRQLSELDIDISAGQRQIICLIFKQLIETKGWANARDVQTLAMSIIRTVFIKVADTEAEYNPARLVVTPEEVISAQQDMLKLRGGLLKAPIPRPHNNELTGLVKATNSARSNATKKANTYVQFLPYRR